MLSRHLALTKSNTSSLENNIPMCSLKVIISVALTVKGEVKH